MEVQWVTKATYFPPMAALLCCAEVQVAGCCGDLHGSASHRDLVPEELSCDLGGRGRK